MLSITIFSAITFRQKVHNSAVGQSQNYTIVWKLARNIRKSAAHTEHSSHICPLLENVKQKHKINIINAVCFAFVGGRLKADGALEFSSTK